MGILEKFSLEGKVAVVTGASSGLGAAFALALAEAGACVALGGRRHQRLLEIQQLIENLGRKAICIQTDVTNSDECHTLAREARNQLGGLDILVNSAGLGATAPATRELPAEFRRVVETNLMGSYWMAQACSKFMMPGASIINVSSVLAFTSAGLPQAAYSASKAAVIGLTRDLAQQWSGRKGIRVNALAPGYFLTEMTDELDPEFLNKITSTRVPMGRLGELDECAAAVVFLASSAASFITGTCLVVDGGLLTL
jgi:NAD(P)-dependent dehydrogenase (short-subunit alcohol dehydrogenase family)